MVLERAVVDMTAKAKMEKHRSQFPKVREIKAPLVETEKDEGNIARDRWPDS
jgi:hypothetical protein